MYKLSGSIPHPLSSPVHVTMESDRMSVGDVQKTGCHTQLLPNELLKKLASGHQGQGLQQRSLGAWRWGGGSSQAMAAMRTERRARTEKEEAEGPSPSLSAGKLTIPKEVHEGHKALLFGMHSSLFLNPGKKENYHVFYTFGHTSYLHVITHFIARSSFP